MKKKTKKKLINFAIAAVVVLAVIGAIMSARSTWPSKTFGDDEIQMHFFHARTCPHCHAQKVYHWTFEEKYPNLNIIEYETSFPSTKKALEAFAEKYPDQLDLARFWTPTTIIGDTVNIWFSETSTPARLMKLIEEEQVKIDENWDANTMTRTIDL